jgi:hypothetical protein
MAERKRANRSRDIPDAESGQSQQNPGGRIVAGKKGLAEDQGGCGSVDEEIVILQHAADPAGDRRLAARQFRKEPIFEAVGSGAVRLAVQQ